MPNTQELQALRQDVAALTAHVAALKPALDNAVTHRSLDEFRQWNDRQRKRTVWAAIVSILAAMLLTIGLDNTMLTRCFLARGANPSHNAVCNVVFPGYNSTVDQSRNNLRQFRQLLASIPENERNNKRQQREINDLKRRLARLGG